MCICVEGGCTSGGTDLTDQLPFLQACAVLVRRVQARRRLAMTRKHQHLVTVSATAPPRGPRPAKGYAAFGRLWVDWHVCVNTPHILARGPVLFCIALCANAKCVHATLRKHRSSSTRGRPLSPAPCPRRMFTYMYTWNWPYFLHMYMLETWCWFVRPATVSWK